MSMTAQRCVFCSWLHLSGNHLTVLAPPTADLENANLSRCSALPICRAAYLPTLSVLRLGNADRQGRRPTDLLLAGSGRSAVNLVVGAVAAN